MIKDYPALKKEIIKDLDSNLSNSKDTIDIDSYNYSKKVNNKKENILELIKAK